MSSTVLRLSSRDDRCGVLDTEHLYLGQVSPQENSRSRCRARGQARLHVSQDRSATARLLPRKLFPLAMTNAAAPFKTFATEALTVARATTAIHATQTVEVGDPIRAPESNQEVKSGGDYLDKGGPERSYSTALGG